MKWIWTVYCDKVNFFDYISSKYIHSQGHTNPIRSLVTKTETATAEHSSDRFAYKEKNGWISCCSVWRWYRQKAEHSWLQTFLLKGHANIKCGEKGFCFRISDFQLYLTHWSPADDCYTAAAAATSDWDTFAAVFWVKFPAPKVQAQTFMEYEQILTELRLDEAKLLERHLNTNNCGLPMSFIDMPSLLTSRTVVLQ